MVAGQNPARGLAGSEGKVGEEHGETEHYLSVVLVRPERVGWGLAEGAVARRQWQAAAAAAALRRAGGGVARPESTSGRRGFRSGVGLGCCGAEEGGRHGGPGGGGNGGDGELEKPRACSRGFGRGLAAALTGSSPPAPTGNGSSNGSDEPSVCIGPQEFAVDRGSDGLFSLRN